MANELGPAERRQGFAAVLRNRHFLRVWIAQCLALTAQNGIHFVQMVLIESLTGRAPGAHAR